MAKPKKLPKKIKTPVPIPLISRKQALAQLQESRQRLWDGTGDIETFAFRIGFRKALTQLHGSN